MCDVKTGTCDHWRLGQTRSLIALCIYKLISVDMSVPHRPCRLPQERPPTSTGESVMTIACFFNSVSTSNYTFISVCFANTEAQMVSGFWSLWRRRMCSFGAAVHPSSLLQPEC